VPVQSLHPESDDTVSIDDVYVDSADGARTRACARMHDVAMKILVDFALDFRLHGRTQAFG
jgi:hypothetical protein